jgi:hypothetical protein
MFFYQCVFFHGEGANQAPWLFLVDPEPEKKPIKGVVADPMFFQCWQYVPELFPSVTVVML